MIRIGYLPEFVRQYEKLPAGLREETKEKIKLFKDRANHKQLHVHKLHGSQKAYWSFSVNYRFRIMFTYVGKSRDHVMLMTVGDHSIYD